MAIRSEQVVTGLEHSVGPLPLIPLPTKLSSQSLPQTSAVLQASLSPHHSIPSIAIAIVHSSKWPTAPQMVLGNSTLLYHPVSSNLATMIPPGLLLSSKVLTASVPGIPFRSWTVTDSCEWNFDTLSGFSFLIPLFCYWSLHYLCTVWKNIQSLLVLRSEYAREVKIRIRYVPISIIKVTTIFSIVLDTPRLNNLNTERNMPYPRCAVGWNYEYIPLWLNTIFLSPYFCHVFHPSSGCYLPGPPSQFF